MVKLNVSTLEQTRLEGSLSLLGGRIDDLRLLDYNVELNDPSSKETLLSPAGGPNAYYATYGWAPTNAADFEFMPSATTPWQLEAGNTLTVSTPVTLRWDNGQGLIFRRVISIDKDYLFSITQSVENTTGDDIRLQPYGIVARVGEPETIGFYILHEGVVRASDGEIQEIDYDDMPDQTADASEGGNVDKIKVEENGWIGFTDKYWMTALIPTPGHGLYLRFQIHGQIGHVSNRYAPADHDHRCWHHRRGEIIALCWGEGMGRDQALSRRIGRSTIRRFH